MAHQVFCDATGHFYECSNPACECVCGSLMEEGDHSECPIELRACPEHENDLTAAERYVVKEAGAVPIHFPPDIEERVERANSQPRCVAWCWWCGHGYGRYTHQLEDAHFAFHCPDAPEELKQNARRSLEQASKKRRCTGQRR